MAEFDSYSFTPNQLKSRFLFIMKYLAVFFITAIAATTLVSSSAVHKEEERQSCDVNRLQNLTQAFVNCAITIAGSCANFGTDICGCCRSIFASGNNGTSIYGCCGTLRDLVAVTIACANQAGTPVPDQFRNCNLGGGAATTTVSYFTGLLLLLTAVTYQFLF